jgi:hypothetical protein
MDVKEEINKVIALLEETISKQESQAKDLDWDIKVKKAKLKQLKKAADS